MFTTALILMYNVWSEVKSEVWTSLSINFYNPYVFRRIRYMYLRKPRLQNRKGNVAMLRCWRTFLCPMATNHRDSITAGDKYGYYSLYEEWHHLIPMFYEVRRANSRGSWLIGVYMTARRDRSWLQPEFPPEPTTANKNQKMLEIKAAQLCWLCAESKR